MAVNKVVFNSEHGEQTLIDLTNDTVTPSSLAEGETAHAANGERIVGTLRAMSPVQSDWKQNDATALDYIKNRTHYSGNVVFLDDSVATTYTHPAFGTMWEIGNAADVTVGKRYTITYNGANFDCVCKLAPVGLSTDPDAVAMGNFAVVGGANTGEPFAMLISKKFNRIDVIDLTGSNSVTVKITGFVTKKLDNQYLDLEWLPVINDAPIIPEQTVDTANKDSNNWFAVGYSITFCNDNSLFNTMDKYDSLVVIFDGKRYPCSVTKPAEESYTVFGNLYIASTYNPNTGEPFLFWITPHGATVAVLTEGVHTFTLAVPEHNKMPAEFLPDAIVTVDEMNAAIAAAISAAIGGSY